MDQLNDRTDITTLVEDISYIKKMISRNSPFLYEAGISRGMQIVSFLGGIVIILFSGIFHWLILKFGAFSLIPSGIKLPLLIVLGVIWVLLGVFKQQSILTTVKSVNPSVTFSTIVENMYNRYIIHTYLPPALITVSLSIYFLLTGNTHFIVPSIAIGLGLITNGASVGFRISEMLFMGYWLLFSGVISLIFNHVSACISLSYSLGLGFIIFSIVAHISSKKREARVAC